MGFGGGVCGITDEVSSLVENSCAIFSMKSQNSLSSQSFIFYKFSIIFQNKNYLFL